MSNHSNGLFDDFHKISRKEWEQKANKDLKEENVFEKLKWQVEKGISASPYYDQSDIATLNANFSFHNRLFNANGAVREWENLQYIQITNEKEGNQLALEALNNGADGIIFDSIDRVEVSFDQLLAGILPEHCSISFNTGTQSINSIQGYLDWLDRQKINNASGLIFSNAQKLPSLEGIAHYKSIRHLHLSATDHSSFSNQMATILVKCVRLIEDHLENGATVNSIVDRCFIQLSLSDNYFEEIAKIKAMRMLFYQVVQSYGYASFLPEDIHIHCVSPVWNDEKYMPHANMLKSTTTAMAAILGGCNSLYITPEDQGNALMVRIARNVSSILKEEAYLNKTADPVAGSYYLENLIDQMAQSSWSKFQQLVSKQNAEAKK